MQYWNVLLYQKLRGCCSRFTNEVHCLLFLELARKGKQYHSHSRQLLVAKVPRFSCLAFQVAKAKWVSFFSLLGETFSSLSKYVDFNNFLLAFISIVQGDDRADFALRSVEHSKRLSQPGIISCTLSQCHISISKVLLPRFLIKYNYG